MKYQILKYAGPQHALIYKHRRRILPHVLATLLAVVLALGGTVFGVYRDLISAQKTDSQVSELLGREAEPPADSYEGRAINILVIGSDQRQAGDADSRLVEGMRSDTTIVMHISADRKRVQAVSIPRDTMVNIPPCPLPDGHSTSAAYGQFNAAFSYGGMTGDASSAVACTIKTVEKMSGLTINEFVLVDMHSMAAMIDALGGINLWSEIEFSEIYSGLKLHKGCNHLDGAQAVAFARTRNKLGDGSDLSRIKRQQRLMSLMYRTAMSKNLTSDLPSLYAFGRSALSSLTTSPGLETTRLAGLAYSMSDIDLKNILFVSLPVAPGNDPKYWGRVFPTPMAPKVWTALIKDEPFPPGLEVRDGEGNAYLSEDPNAPKADSKDAPAHSQNGDTQQGSQNQESQGEGNESESEKPNAIKNATPLSANNPETEAERIKCEP